jgi:hypothetical protein
MKQFKFSVMKAKDFISTTLTGLVVLGVGAQFVNLIVNKGGLFPIFCFGVMLGLSVLLFLLCIKRE